jgi:hypothetical protein
VGSTLLDRAHEPKKIVLSKCLQLEAPKKTKKVMHIGHMATHDLVLVAEKTEFG